MRKFLSVLICIFLLAGCAPASVDNAESFNIVTSFYPVYVFTSNIIKDADGVLLQNLTDADIGCLHDYTVTPKDMRLLESADLLIINGAGMEEFVINAPSDLTVCDSSEGILCISHHNEINAHIWLSVPNAITQVQNITSSLCKADAKNSAVYQKNAKEYIARLSQLDKDIRDVTDNITKRNIVTFHEAFPYFAKEYGLNIVDTIHTTHTDSEVPPAKLTDIINKIKSGGADALFTEPLHSSSAADIISSETGIPLYSLDPVVSGDMCPDAYEKAMQNNLKTIKEVLK